MPREIFMTLSVGNSQSDSALIDSAFFLASIRRRNAICKEMFSILFKDLCLDAK